MLKPINDRVIILPDAAETTTKSGLFIPDSVKEKPQFGTVIAAGEGDGYKPMTVKEGDRVLYGKYAGIDINIEGKDYLILRETDIFAII